MFKIMSIRLKLFILITLAVIITFGTVSILVSSRSIEMAQDDAFALADELSAKYSYEVKSELQAARATSESLMTVFQTLIEQGEADRDTLNEILQNSLRQKKYIISFCVAFEPDGLDGQDALYAGQYPLYDETGRYAPYWSMQEGVIDVEPLSDFDDDDWYAGARDSGKEYITDPFIFEVQGEPVLMTSLVFPIMIEGEFVGIVSSDMALDSLQEMVSQVDTSGLGEYTVIYSNSGIVVAHPDNNHFNKSIYATAAYDLLIAKPTLAPEALEITQHYLDSIKSHDTTDEVQVEEYESTAAFAKNLTGYVEDPTNNSLDLTLLTNSLAIELLQLDTDRLTRAEEATTAIAEGQSYTFIQDDYYKVFMPIQFSEDTNPWSVAVNVPMSVVLQKSNDLRNYVVLISIVGILFIALVLYLVTRNLTEPILKLAESAKQVGEGNFNVEVPKTKNKDEVGILSTAFTTMVKQINVLVDKLTKNSEELAEKNQYLAKLNTELLEAKDQAEASNRAKTVFLSNMSHEMRTPLNAIVGMTAVGQNASGSDTKDDAFAKIDEASSHLLSMINDILDMSKMETNRIKLTSHAFDFTKMINSSLAIITPLLEEKEQALTIELDDHIPALCIGDDFRLSQVLMNLLSNAVKFTDRCGNIGLKASVKERQDRDYILQFEVSDTGIGISNEQQKKLFRMFEQADDSTSRSFGGAGLGLALSKRIVELMEGAIWVESAPGAGSTFFFTVKVQGATEDAAEQEASEPNAQDFGDKTILLAEDIAINREIVFALLEATNIKIEYAVTGKEAYEMFAAEPTKYDLILMDIQMPEMDGIQATKLIRTLDDKVPIIALTANVFEEDIETYLQNGMTSHISKPLDYELTMEMLRNYLGS